MADTAGLESDTRPQQNKSTLDSLALDIAALLPRLRHYALHLTRDAVAADDLAQEAVVRGMEHIHLWRQGTDFQAWLFTILHNRYVSDIRRAVRHSTLIGSICAGQSALCSPRQVERLQLRDLERALSKLPDEQQTVVMLVGLEGERYDAVATRLGVPAGTVRSRLSRGRRRLRELIDGRPAPEVASGLIRRDRRSLAGRAGRVGDRDRSTPRLTASLTLPSSPAPR
jgi:RNA polymerase sigma-70 factor, ECF subfamily